MEESPSLVDLEEAPETTAEAELGAQPAWVSYVAAAFPVLMCFLGTGRSPWAFGLAAAVIGALAVAFPPKRQVPVGLLAAAGIITLFTALPMLPLPWPHWPEWRTVMKEDFSLPLPSTWSIQPLVTFENWAGMMVMGLWFFWTTCRAWPSDDRTQSMRILAAGFIALSIAALVCRAIGWKPPGWNPVLADIGPYANRNHFSCLMAMTALLCFGASYELQRRKNALWMVYALGVVPTFAVTLLNTSRAGLVLFFLAIMLWFFTSSMGSSASNRKSARFAVRMAVTISFTFMLVAGVVLFGQPLLKRFGGGDAGVTETLANDARLAVYEETLPFAADQPMMGVGLGNFGTVFGVLHHLPNAYTRFRHPESDWLWFLSEAGWPATFAMLLGVGMLFIWMEPWRQAEQKKGRRERRLRRAAGLAFLLSIGHGLIDTPNHDLPQLLLVMLLAALALRGDRMALSRGISLPWLFRIGGVGALAASALWFATNAGMATPFGQSRGERDILLARAAMQKGEAASAYNHACLAIAAAPAAWEPYFLRAQAALKLGHPETEAMADFGRSRHLEPHVTQKCMEEAATWLSYSPINALPAWREALRRDPVEANNLYRRILDSVIPYPELRPALRDLALTPGLLVTYLATAYPSEIPTTLDILLQRYPTLEPLKSYDRQTVMQRWLSGGDRKKLAVFLEGHPALDPDTWPIKAQMLSEDGKLEQAFRLLQQYVHPPLIILPDSSASLPQLEREFQLYPSDAKRGLSLFMAQRDKSLWDEALATLERIAALPNRPRHVFFDIATVYAQKGDYARAWQFAQQYLNTPE